MNREVLQRLLDKYVSLVNCGDCGNWDPETEQEVIDARVELAKTDVEIETLRIALERISEQGPPAEYDDSYQEWGNMGDAYSHGSECGRAQLGDIARLALQGNK